MGNKARPLIPIDTKKVYDLADALSQNAQPAPDQSSSSPSPATRIQNPEKYIILPSKTHDKYSYPDLVVAMDRTYHGKNWDDTHKALSQEGSSMLNIRQFVDFLNLIRSGKAFNGSGSPVDKRKLDSILDEIMTVRTPWRSEWLDAKFESKGGFAGVGSKMFINYEHSLSNGKLTPKYSEELKDYLQSDKTPGIDMNAWLGNANEQGLPRANSPDGKLYYWHPRNGKVAGFGANSDRAYLDCLRYPSGTVSDLGVRAARKKI